MKIIWNQAIIDQFPEAGAHGAAFDFVERLDWETVEAHKIRAVEAVRTCGIRPELLVEQDFVKEWRAAYKKFGANPAKKRSSIEQLYKRGLQGNLVETKLNLVNLYCHLSTVHRVPMGGYDMEKICGNISVRHSTGECFLGIGERVPEDAPSGWVVYADAQGVICLSWNHRDSARTCIQPFTRRAVFFADAVSLPGMQRAAAAIDDLTATLTSSGSTLISRFHVGHGRVEAQFEEDIL